jgi:hypothetical protein
LKPLELPGERNHTHRRFKVFDPFKGFNLLSMLGAADAVGGLNLSAAAEPDRNFAGFNDDRYLPAAIRMLKHSL